jgi:peptide chain release factor subunit 1
MDKWEEFEEKIGKMNCLSCEEGSYEIEKREDLIEVLVKKAEEAKAKMEIISTHIEEGEMLFRSFGGIAAITKYRTF